jgi:hypothetical protein
MLNEQTKEYIDSLSDEMLYQYAIDTETGYSEEASAYAKQRMAKKQFGPEQIASFVATGAERERVKTEEAQVATEERAVLGRRALSRGIRVVFFVLGFFSALPVLLIFWIVWKVQGKRLMARQALMAWLAGFGTAILLFLATPLIRAILR